MIYEGVIYTLSEKTDLGVIRNWMICKIAQMIWQHVEYLLPCKSKVDDWLSAEDYVNRTVPEAELIRLRKILSEGRAKGFSNNWPLIHLYSDDANLLKLLGEKFKEGRDLDAYLGGIVWRNHFERYVVNQLPRPPYGYFRQYIPNKI